MLLLFASAVAAPGLAYRLAPVFDDARALQALAVELQFEGDADGTTRLTLPDRWVGATEYWRYVRDVTFDGATSTTPKGPAGWVLRHPPGAEITVRYSVVSAYPGDPGPSDDGTPYAPIVRPTWFLAHGSALFAIPGGHEASPVAFTWEGPEGFGFASDLEHLAGSRPGTVLDVIESVAIGGTDLRVSTAEDGRTRVATLGAFGFDHDAFADVALQVLASEREFWGGDSEPFLVTLAPLKAEPERYSYGGTGRSDAFALEVSENVGLSELRFLLAHEYFHTWNPRRLGELTDGRQEAAGYWWSEGFTDFYTWRIAVRSGLYSIEEFVEAWNTMLVAYAVSSVQTEPNRRVVRDFWRDPEVEKLPYQRGALLAAIWDARLRERSEGRVDLDDVLYAMRDEALAEPGRPGVERFERLYAEYGGGKVDPELRRHVARGGPIRLPEGVFGGCVTVETNNWPTFERGWDAEATHQGNNVVVGLSAESPAFEAGLRNGMRIVERVEGVPGDARVPYVLRVDDRGTERTIRFTPAGSGTLTVQELVLAGGLSDGERAACARTLGGQ